PLDGCRSHDRADRAVRSPRRLRTRRSTLPLRPALVTRVCGDAGASKALRCRGRIRTTSVTLKKGVPPQPPFETTCDRGHCAQLTSAQPAGRPRAAMATRRLRRAVHRRAPWPPRDGSDREATAGEITEMCGALEVPMAHRPAATLSNAKGKREAPSLSANVVCPHSSQTNRSEP